MLLLLNLLDRSVGSVDSILSLESFLDQLFFLFLHLQHFGFLPALDLFSLLDDVLLHLVDIFGVNFQNGRILVNDFSLNVPLVGLGDVHDDFFAE